MYCIAGNFHQGKFVPNLASTTAENFCQIYFHARTFVTNRRARAVMTKMRKAANQGQGALHYTMAELSDSIPKPRPL